MGWGASYSDFVWTHVYSKVFPENIGKVMLDRPTKLTTLADIAIHGALGKTNQIEFSRNDFIDWEK